VFPARGLVLGPPCDRCAGRQRCRSAPASSSIANRACPPLPPTTGRQRGLSRKQRAVLLTFVGVWRKIIAVFLCKRRCRPVLRQILANSCRLGASVSSGGCLAGVQQSGTTRMQEGLVGPSSDRQSGFVVKGNPGAALGESAGADGAMQWGRLSPRPISRAPCGARGKRRVVSTWQPSVRYAGRPEAATAARRARCQ